MNDSLLQKDITKVLGIDELSPNEQAKFLAEVGDVILERSLLQFSASLTDEQHIALQEYLETDPEPEVLMNHLLKHYDHFEGIIENVVLEFKEDALKVLGEDDDADVQVVENE